MVKFLDDFYDTYIDKREYAELQWYEAAAASLLIAVLTFLALQIYYSGPEVRRSGFSVVVNEEEQIHRGPEKRNELVTTLPNQPDRKTLHDNYQYAAKKFASNRCYGWRDMSSGTAGPYQWMTYKEANIAATEFGAGLMSYGMMPENPGSGQPSEPAMAMLGLFSKNRPEWVIAEQGCFMHSGTTVPLYDTLGAEVLVYILNQTKLKTVVCAKSEVSKLLPIAKECPSLKFIVQMDATSGADVATADKSGIKLVSYADVREKGRSDPCPMKAPTPDTIATFCYTSGTTGHPKGVLLTHRNLFAALAGAEYRGITTTHTDVHLSYLPLAHVMERLIQISLINAGASIGFYQGDTLKITQDLTELRPTLFPSVPRLLNKVYDKITAGASASKVKGFLFKTALAQKTANLKATGAHTHALWDKLVFQKVALKLGLERCRLIVTGSAPISAQVLDFLRVVFSATVVEGYGQSETAAAATLTASNDVSSGHVGAPTASVECKLVDVPDMGYLAKDTEHETGEGQMIKCKGRGEICFRGPSVFAQYYKMPEETAKTIDKEGWCHTGDVGIWLTGGQLRIVDRVKNMFKLSQGEYVAAEKIENVYVTNEYVGQVFLYGDSLQHCVVAVVVPDFDVLKGWADANGKPSDQAALCKDADVNAMILKSMTATGRAAKLHGFELAKAIHLTHELFSVENDLLTPTFKLKRHQAKKQFKAEIDKMYKSLA